MTDEPHQAENAPEPPESKPPRMDALRWLLVGVLAALGKALRWLGWRPSPEPPSQADQTGDGEPPPKEIAGPDGGVKSPGPIAGLTGIGVPGGALRRVFCAGPWAPAGRETKVRARAETRSSRRLTA